MTSLERDILYILTNLLAMVPFLLVCKGIAKINLPKRQRYKQALLPLVALVFCIIVMLEMGRALGGLWLLWALVEKYVPVLNGLYAAGIISIVLNFLIALVFFIVKRIVRNPLARVVEKHSGLFEPFYHMDETDSEFYLMDKLYQVRGILRACLVASVVVGCLMCSLSITYAGVMLFRNLFFPAFTVLVLGEVYYFLAGLTRSERHDSASFEADESSHIVDFYPLMKAYKRLFGARVLDEAAIRRRTRPVSNSMDVYEPLQESTVQEERVAGAFLEMLCLRRHVIDPDKASAMVELMKGRNLIFSSPFYRDYTYTVLFPAHRRLMQNKCVLFVCGPKSNESLITDWAQENLDFISSVPNLWRVGSLDESDDDRLLHVGVMGFSQLNDFAFLSNHEGFIARCGYVVFFDPSDLLTTTQIGLRMMARMMEDAGAKPTFVAFDINTDGLVDALSHTLLAEFVEVQATQVARGVSCSMMWNADGDNMHLKLFDDSVRYLGVGTELATVALAHQVSEVEWRAHKAVPLLDARWLAQQYYDQICSYAELTVTQRQVDESIAFIPALWDGGQEQRSFLVVEDETNNMYEAARQFSTRSNQNSFVNVVSGSYLLRDYMRFNARMFRNDPKAIPLIVPDFVKSVRNTLAELLFKLYLEPVPMHVVNANLKAIGLSDKGTYGGFIELLAKYYPPAPEALEASPYRNERDYMRNVVRHRMERIIDREKYRFKDVEVVYFHDDESVVDSCFAALKNSYYIAEDEVEEGRTLGSRLYGHIYQEILPGQFTVIDGKYYEALSITMDSGVLLRRAADHFTGRRYYRQLRSYELSDCQVDNRLNRTRRVSGVQVTLLEATVKVSTEGYLISSDYGDFSSRSAHRVQMDRVPERMYRHREVLKVAFTPDMGATDQDLVTLAFLLNELMRTVFANDNQYLSVTCPLAQDGAILMADQDDSVAYDLPSGALHSVTVTGDETGEHAIYVIEDSEIDLGLLTAFDRNLDKFLGIVRDLLDWHIAKMSGELEEDDTSESYEMGDTHLSDKSDDDGGGDDDGKLSLLDIIRIIFSGRDPNRRSRRKEKQKKQESQKKQKGKKKKKDDSSDAPDGGFAPGGGDTPTGGNDGASSAGGNGGGSSNTPSGNVPVGDSSGGGSPDALGGAAPADGVNNDADGNDDGGEPNV